MGSYLTSMVSSTNDRLVSALRILNVTKVTLSSTRMWADANMMAALPNIGGALSSTPQSFADAHYWSTVHNAAKT